MIKPIRVLQIIGLILLIQWAGCKKEDKNSLYVSQTNVTFDYTEDNVTIMVSNTGSKEFSWTATVTADFVQLSKSSGTCQKNSPDQFDIQLLREKIHADSIKTYVKLTTSSGESVSISLFIHGFPESKIRYNSTVVDATYDYAHDRLVILANSSGDYLLDIYDVREGIFHRVPLDDSPGYVSVSPDGMYAVAGSGSGNNIIHIDLTTYKVVNTYSVEDYTYEAVPCNDKQVYYFPGYSNYTIGRLNLNTGSTQSFNLGSYFSSLTAELHPSGNYIYAAGSYDLYKFSIGASGPQLLYSTSTYDMNSELWLSRDGSKIFTSDKNILYIDPQLPGNDITQTGELQLLQNYLYIIRQNPILNEYYAVGSNSSYSFDSNSDHLVVFNSNFDQGQTIHFEKYYLRPSMQEPYVISDGIADYMFVSSDGSKIIVISHSEQNGYYSTARGIEIIARGKKKQA